ncbi:superoxide dismutase [Spiroplasma endosymbiont of Anurida maritima]|uniref:superoxide dismutase n=1 Tax=Spiroplasma endosymbiont of Anurida maritima TaxID=2967972 RepID=UPI0036D43CA7
MFKRIQLPYKMNELAPFLSEEQINYHYNKHHLAYETVLNSIISDHKLPSGVTTLKDINQKLHLFDKKIQSKVRNMAGGLINHNLYFDILAKNGVALKNGSLMKAINDKFGSYESLIKEVVENCMSVFGSGWTWLILNDKKELEIINTINQDNPWMLGLEPILGIDVWEHAYYVDYRNDRKAYIENILKVINWDKIEKLYNEYK